MNNKLIKEIFGDTMLSPKEIKKAFKVGSLISKGSSNYKTAKNNRMTGIVYLSPLNMNSLRINLCKHASSGCAAACLFTAGRGKFSNVEQARINRSEMLVGGILGFLIVLVDELEKMIRKSEKEGLELAIRLNGTSDVDFLKLLQDFGWDYRDTPSSVKFYDYTKSENRALKYLGDEKYSLTYSVSEKKGSYDFGMAFAEMGGNSAVVFRKVPRLAAGIKVVNGDDRDDLMMDVKGVILGLTAKGAAKHDKSGFVY